MTILAFPDTTGKPTDGSFTYEENGVIYSWTGDYWAANNAQGFDQRYVNADGDQMTGDLTVPSLNGGPLAGLRNQIINGNFSIWQRGDDITVPGDAVNGAAYTADRWLASQANVRMQAATPSASLPNLGWCAVFSAARTADYIEQPIELVRNGRLEPFFPGTTWTFSFYHDKNLEDFTFGCGFVDTSASLASGDVVLPDTTALTSLGNSRYSCTFTVPENQTIASTRKAFVVRIASSRNSVITGARLTGCQLEPGPVATPVEIRPIGLEMSLCQRYYQELPEMCKTIRAQDGTGVFADATVPLFVTMRITPTLSFTRKAGDLSKAPIVWSELTNRFSVSVKYDGLGDKGQSVEFQGTADAEL